MKKIINILLVLLFAITLFGCDDEIETINQEDAPTSNLSIVTPTGAPAFAFYFEEDNPNFETNSTPTNIVAMMSDGSNKDIIVIDTVSGIKAINNGANYKLAATITFGNFFIASTGNDDNFEMDTDDVIVLFGQGQTPDYVFHYLFDEKYDGSIEYVTNVQDAAKCLIAGKNEVTGSEVDYVFIAQPALFNALNKNEKASIYANIQDLYKEKSNGLSMIQASVFINNNLDKEVASQYLAILDLFIQGAITTPSIITDTLEDKDPDEMASLFGIAPEVAVKVLKDNNGIGLGFAMAIDIKEDIDNFVKLFGMEKTSEKIYFE